MGQHCQHVDEAPLLLAEPRLDHLAGDFGFDDMHRMGKWDGLVRVKRRPPLLLREAGFALRCGGHGLHRCAKRQTKQQCAANPHKSSPSCSRSG